MDKTIIMLLEEAIKTNLEGAEKLTNKDNIIFIYEMGKDTISISAHNQLMNLKASTEFCIVPSKKDLYLEYAYKLGQCSNNKKQLCIINSAKDLPDTIKSKAQIYTSITEIFVSNFSNMEENIKIQSSNKTKKTENAIDMSVVNNKKSNTPNTKRSNKADKERCEDLNKNIKENKDENSAEKEEENNIDITNNAEHIKEDNSEIKENNDLDIYQKNCKPTIGTKSLSKVDKLREYLKTVSTPEYDAVRYTMSIYNAVLGTNRTDNLEEIISKAMLIDSVGEASKVALKGRYYKLWNIICGEK